MGVSCFWCGLNFFKHGSNIFGVAQLFFSIVQNLLGWVNFFVDYLKTAWKLEGVAKNY